MYDEKMAELLNLEKFSAWLDTQPPEKEYTYLSFGNCAIAQYLKANGIERVAVLSHAVHPGIDPEDQDWGKGYPLPYKMNGVAVSHDGRGNRTFGAAAKTAKRLLETV